MMKHAKDYLLGTLTDAEIHVHQEPDDNHPNYFLGWVKRLFLSAILVSSSVQGSDATPKWAQDLSSELQGKSGLSVKIHVIPEISGLASSTCMDPSIDRLLKSMLTMSQDIAIRINKEKVDDNKILIEQAGWLLPNPVKTGYPIQFVGYHELFHGIAHCVGGNRLDIPNYISNTKDYFRKLLFTTVKNRADADDMAQVINSDYMKAYEESLADAFAFLMLAKSSGLDEARKVLDSVIDIRYMSRFDHSAIASHDTVKVLESFQAMSDSEIINIIADKNGAEIAKEVVSIVERRDAFPSPDQFLKDRMSSVAAKAFLIGSSPRASREQQEMMVKWMQTRQFKKSRDQIFAHADRYLKVLHRIHNDGNSFFLKQISRNVAQFGVNETDKNEINFIGIMDTSKILDKIKSITKTEIIKENEDKDEDVRFGPRS